MFRSSPFSLVVLALIAGAAAGCDEPPEFADIDMSTARELEVKVDGLQQRVDTLKEKAKDMPKAAAGQAGQQRDPAREKAAYAVYQETMAALQSGDYETAKKKLEELEKFKDVPPAVAAAKEIRGEIELIGKPSTPLKVDKWFVGEANMDDGKATVLVFWEVWCPHCRREVPKLQATYEKYNKRGLNLIGVTQVNNGKTDDEVMAFIDEQKVSYPTAKTGADIPNHYNVNGVPAAAVVKDGKIVWRGHPAQLSDDLIEGWLGS